MVGNFVAGEFHLNLSLKVQASAQAQAQTQCPCLWNGWRPLVADSLTCTAREFPRVSKMNARPAVLKDTTPLYSQSVLQIFPSRFVWLEPCIDKKN